MGSHDSGYRAGLFTTPSGAVFTLDREGHLHALWGGGRKPSQLCCFEEVAERDRSAVWRWLEAVRSGAPVPASPPPADRPVAGWLTMTDEEFERIAEAMSGRTMYPGREPLRDERLLREAKAQRAEVARLTEERDSYRRGWNRAEDCQTRLRSQRDEAVRTATSALALAREYAAVRIDPTNPEAAIGTLRDLRAKLDAIATGGG